MSHNQDSNTIDQSSDQINNGLPETPSLEDDIFKEYEEGPLESRTPSRTSSIPEEYVLANPSEESNQIAGPSSIPQPRRARQVIQDEYDENNYTLARPSDDSNDDTLRTVDHEDNQRLARCSMTKRTKLILFICIFVVISVTGGIIAYIALGKQGNKNIQSELVFQEKIYQRTSSKFHIIFHNFSNHTLRTDSYNHKTIAKLHT